MSVSAEALMERKNLVKVAKELNEVLGLEPQIDIEAEDDKLKDLILEAAKLIQPGDDLSIGTMRVVRVLQKKWKKEQPTASAEESEEPTEEESEEPTEEESEEPTEEVEEPEEGPAAGKKGKSGKDKNEKAEKAEKADKKAGGKAEKAEKTDKKSEQQEPAPEPGKITMTQVMDEVLSKGGTWETMTKAVRERAAELGYDPLKYPAYVLRAHAKYRTTKGKNRLNIKITETGVEKGE